MDILKDPFHPGHLFELLPSGKCFRSIKSRTNRLKNSFYPSTIRELNDVRIHTHTHKKKKCTNLMAHLNRHRLTTPSVYPCVCLQVYILYYSVVFVCIFCCTYLSFMVCNIMQHFSAHCAIFCAISDCSFCYYCLLFKLDV